MAANTWQVGAKPQNLHVCAFSQQQKNAPTVMFEAGVSDKEKEKNLEPTKYPYFVQPMQLCYDLASSSDGETRSACTRGFVTKRTAADLVTGGVNETDFAELTRANFVGVSVGSTDKQDSSAHKSARRVACSVSGVAVVMVPYEWLKLMPVGTLVRGVCCINHANETHMRGKNASGVEYAAQNYIPSGSPETRFNDNGSTGYIFPFPLSGMSNSAGGDLAATQKYAIGTVVEHPDKKYKENWVKIALL